MNMLEMMNKLTQLSEATKDTGKGKIHTADPGGYGRKDDEEDEDGKKKATPASTEKKGRGRPKKATQTSGEDKKYDTDTLGSVFGGGKKPSKAVDKLPKKKNSLKEYFDSLDKALNEAEQIQIKPASQMPKTPGQTAGATSQPGQPQGVQGQPGKNTQVIAQGNKTLGTVDNPQLAQQIKQSIGKGEMTLMPEGEMEEGVLDTLKKVGGKVLDKLGHGSDEDLLKDLQRKAGIPAHAQHGKPAMAQSKEVDESALQAYLGDKKYGKEGMDALRQAGREHASKEKMANIRAKYDKLDEVEMDEASYSAKDARAGKDIGKPGKAFSKIAKDAGERYGSKAAGERVAGAVLNKLRHKTNEADVPPSDDDMGAGLGAGRSQGVLEGRAKADNKAEKAGKKVTKDLEYDMYHKGKDDNKAEKAGKKVTKDIEWDEKHKTNESAKPDFLDMDKDGNKKESMKKAVADKKKMKVKEGMDSILKAAHHAGKSHALSKQGYNCTFEDMEEARCYHEGYKQGLDECYDQMPIQGYVGEANPSIVDDMASYGAHTPEVDEGNAFTAALKNTPKGGKFSVGGKTFTDHSSLEESPFAFESLEQQLNALLEDKEDVAEGMTVSISKGQQGQPDSVSINAQDSEAEQLLALVKQAGLGLFGGDEPAHTGSQMSINADGPMAQEPGAEIEVVDDHDDMLSLIRKMTGQGAAPVASSDYEDEESSHEEGHDHDDSCNECGMTYESCGCDGEEETVEEDETLDQREEEVAEAEEVVNNNDEAEEEQSDATRDAALAQAASQNFADTDAPIKEDDTEEDELDESYANGDDDTFETDIDFMTNVITGGLNKKKATGQSTIPVVASQASRLGNPMQESVDLLTDWKSLAGIK